MKRLALALLLLASTAAAEVPSTMNIQGVLTDAAGDPVGDGDYNVDFRFYASETATTPIQTNDWDVWVTGGMFSFVMDMTGWLDLGWFENEIWLGLSVSGEPEMSPRIRLTSVPYAFRAAIADSLAGGAAGDDDWETLGGDIYRLNGRVYVGVTPGGDPRDAESGRDEGPREPATSKMTIEGIDEGFQARVTQTNSSGDSRFGVYGIRTREGRNDGSNYTYFGINAAVGGYNEWGDSYTFGVAGHSYFDYPHTAGVLGADNNGNTWAALAYQDENYAPWGLYTPADAHVGGVAELGGLRLGAGAAAGYIMTSDGSGNASWQAPGASGADADWEIVGDDVYHSVGRVLVGVPSGAAARAREPREGGGRYPNDSLMKIEGVNRGLFSEMVDTDGAADSRYAIYGSRTRDVRNDGTGYGYNDVNAAVGAFNVYGDSYTFGVAGHTWFDYPHTAGVLGANHYGDTWGALGYQDDAFAPWGLYTPVNAHVGGTAELGGLRLGGGAAAGYILTSDGAGNASWQAPGASGTDADWTISGDDLFHDGGGTVAVGSASPLPMISGQAMLQVSASLWPGLTLDSEANGFSRWSIVNEGIGDELEFGYSTNSGVLPPAVMSLSSDGRLAVKSGLTGAALSLRGGNGEINGGSGDFWVGGSGHSFELGVYTAGAEAGEVNARAVSNTGVARLDLGVDDHDVLSLHDYEADLVNAAGAPMVALSSMDDMGDAHGTMNLYGSASATPALSLGASTNGESYVDMRQQSGDLGVAMDSQGTTYGGGEITLYNAAGEATLILDGQHSSGGTSRVTTDALSITGGADLSEQFDVGEDGRAAEPGMVVSIDPERPGRLALSAGAYDSRVAGVISGAGGVRTGMLMGQQGSLADGELPVALAGRVYVWADASAGPIEPGDLLTTASRPGHAMRVDDRDRAGGAILGKAMTGLESGRGLVLVLVSLQ